MFANVMPPLCERVETYCHQDLQQNTPTSIVKRMTELWLACVFVNQTDLVRNLCGKLSLLFAPA